MLPTKLALIALAVAAGLTAALPTSADYLTVPDTEFIEASPADLTKPGELSQFLQAKPNEPTGLAPPPPTSGWLMQDPPIPEPELVETVMMKPADLSQFLRAGSGTAARSPEQELIDAHAILAARSVLEKMSSARRSRAVEQRGDFGAELLQAALKSLPHPGQVAKLDGAALAGLDSGLGRRCRDGNRFAHPVAESGSCP